MGARHPPAALMDAWAALRGQGFPEALTGLSADGVDLLSLHTHAVGCVELFIRAGCRLDAAGMRLFQGTLFEVRWVADRTHGAAGAHFAEVKDVLERVAAELFGAQ